MQARYQATLRPEQTTEGTNWRMRRQDPIATGPKLPPSGPVLRFWYPESGSNRHVQRTQDFESSASTNSAIRAREGELMRLQSRRNGKKNNRGTAYSAALIHPPIHSQFFSRSPYALFIKLFRCGMEVCSRNTRTNHLSRSSFFERFAACPRLSPPKRANRVLF